MPGLSPELLNDRRIVRNALFAAARTCGLHIVQGTTHRFNPHGVTGSVLLRESHVSIHTWPELGFAVVDVLSCATIDRKLLVESFQRYLAPATVAIRTAGRLRNVSKHS